MPTQPGAPMQNSSLFIVRTVEPWPDLYERFWDGDEWVWINHGRPEGIPLVFAPGAAMMNRKLFVAAADGRLFERYRRDDGKWVWVDHGRPNGERVVRSPGAAMSDSRFFVITSDGHVFERNWDGGQWIWIDHGYPGSGALTSPSPVMGGNRFFIGNLDGRMFERNWDGTRWTWIDHGLPGTGIKDRPGVVMGDSVYCTSKNGHLYERHWDGIAWAWIDHGKPPRSRCVSSPGAGMMNSKLFIRGSGGVLWERYRDGSAWTWVRHGRPPGTYVNTAPGAAMMDSKLFMGTRNQRMFERYWNGTEWVWVDHGTLLHDTATMLVDNSAAGTQKLTLAVVGEGFTEKNIGTYEAWVQSELISGVFGKDIFAEYNNAFNVVRVNLISLQSGVSKRTYDEHGTPADASDDTIEKDDLRWTRLGIIYSGSWAHCWMEGTDGTQRVLRKVLSRLEIDWDFVLIVLNTSGWGGCGGGRQQSVTMGGKWDVIAHEFGHGMFGLSDEYATKGKSFTGTTWGGLNCSVTADRQNLPWADLVNSATQLPTPESAGSGNPNGLVGAFEGCGTFETGLYRPVLSCRMRDNSPPFCPVCARHVREQLDPYK